MRHHDVPRLEDLRLIAGSGRYVSDFLEPGLLWAGFLRTDVATGRIAGLDTSSARAMPGVRAIFTAADLDADGVGPMQHDPMRRDDGGPVREFPQPILVADKIGHIGEPIALVIAESRSALADAIEAIDLEIEDAPPSDGIAFCHRKGDTDAVDAAFARAAHSHEVSLDIPRMTAMALETRGVIARGAPDGSLHYRASTQNPFALRNQMAAHFGWDADSLHVQAADVGGSFGLKGYMAAEDAALAWAARRLQAGIAWISTRSEAMLSDAQGRSAKAELGIALDADLRILALRAWFEIDVGAYPSRRSMGISNNLNGVTGVYHVPLVAAEVRGRLSPRAPLAPFRGNGRPEATYAIECALDRIARKIGVDPVVLRERNVIAPEDLPLKTELGATLDCGDFPKVMAKALGLNAGSDARRAEAEAAGRLYGVGLANCIESAGGPMRAPKPDFARLSFTSEGRVILAPGVMSVGQGHETGLARMVAERLEIGLDAIDYRHGDTRAITFGKGSGGSAGLTVAGSALWQVLDSVLADGAEMAARALGCATSDLRFRDGQFFREGSNDAMSLADLAATQPDGIWMIEQKFTPDAATFPNGTHICEVEIDPDTGVVTVKRYVAVEDVGRVLNPVLVEGQLQGGIAQGLSLGLGEQMVYDETGQILTGTLMDYQVVRAMDLPMFRLDTLEVPTALNPLGVKGVGEAGSVGATAALASAVGDALWRAGVSEFDLPATGCRVWQALQAAKTSG